MERRDLVKIIATTVGGSIALPEAVYTSLLKPKTGRSKERPVWELNPNLLRGETTRRKAFGVHEVGAGWVGSPSVTRLFRIIHGIG